jgi:hypothetical protein
MGDAICHILCLRSPVEVFGVDTSVMTVPARVQGIMALRCGAGGHFADNARHEGGPVINRCDRVAVLVAPERPNQAPLGLAANVLLDPNALRTLALVMDVTMQLQTTVVSSAKAFSLTLI